MKFQRIVSISLAFVVFAGLAGAATAKLRTRKAEQPAPAFSVESLDGKSLQLDELKGKPVVVDFWATWCGPCRYAMPHLDAMRRRFGDQGLVVIGVSVDDVEPARVKRFVDRLGVGFEIAMANDEILDEYGPIVALPTTFFIDRNGVVARRVVGYIDEETLDTYVREIVNSSVGERAR